MLQFLQELSRVFVCDQIERLVHVAYVSILEVFSGFFQVLSGFSFFKSNLLVLEMSETKQKFHICFWSFLSSAGLSSQN